MTQEEIIEIIDDVIVDIIETHHDDTKVLERLQKKYNCTINIDVEKIHELQETIYYDIEFEGVEEHLYLEVENGINNGTRLDDSSWGDNLKSDTKEVEVLKDIIFDENEFNKWYSGNEENRALVKNKAIILFNNNKNMLLKLYREQNYDNYVTGGGTNKTDSYYKDKLNELSNKGVFYEYIFEVIEVQRNFK